MDQKTFNELLDALLYNPDDMGHGIHSELVMNAYVDTLTGFGEYLWWNLCFDGMEPIYSCKIDPMAFMKHKTWAGSEDMAIKRKLREQAMKRAMSMDKEEYLWRRSIGRLH